MARITKPLTNTEVERTKAKTKDYSLYDGNGLTILIRPNGAKLWRFRYTRPFSTKRALIGLGQYPAVTLAQARSIRDEYLSLLAQNIDPQIYRQKLEDETMAKQDNTLLNVARDWRNKKATEVKETTLSKNWKRLENHLFKHLGHYPITDINPRLVITALTPLYKQEKFETLHRCVSLLNEIMKFALNCGILEFNKCGDVGSFFPRQTVIHNPAIRPEELPQFLTKLRHSNLSAKRKQLILWQLLTMVRSSEAVTVEWAEIDFKNKLWTIPAEKMKGGKRSHTVPLSTQALNVLEVMKEISNYSRYISPFNDKQPNRPMNKETVNNAIRSMGYGGKLVAHGLRSIASTYLNETFLEQYDVIEACLSHEISNAVRKAYNRSNYLEQRKPLMQCWGDYVESCSKGL
ncbi:integrase arm-type DNA-binding domain-containing protein [Phocoenobacter skyensis]|uniref:Tyrosine-type recombinase/integrase n=1 Tax=Phocoenobacter skyensis TaxID=97481 RepID=A0ABT9JLB3_9PAST|nr:integrase arm-type DNA-binding domain-containing protein [Pasteurella skyensis]MDP8079701.1 tyrosine-type recombinase/integrase [Pasteurella skyensis]MDP8085599.1 tyrosine-type recombinase/integrase [Pasteurella skyensis]